MKRAGFDHNNFYGAQFYGRIGYHDFEGITLYAEERGRMLASLGDKHVLVLRNHGIAVCGARYYDPPTFALLLRRCSARRNSVPDLATPSAARTMP